MAEPRRSSDPDHDDLIAQLARLDEALDGNPTGAPADSTVKQLKAELDTLLSDVRQPPPLDEFADESGCRRVIELIQATGNDPCATINGVPGRIASEGEDLGSLREYKLLSKLGQGGMGTVYKALHTKLDKIVALKVLPSDKLRDEHAVTRFGREMKAVGKLEHPNIVRATDAGEINGQHFLVMEHVDGLDLSTIVHRLGALPVADACEVVRQAAIGLQHAHEHGLVHRDIKPSNLMVAVGRQRSAVSQTTGANAQRASGSRPSTLDSQPSIKLLDMGLALLEEHRLAEQRELTTTGQMMGTLDYMAPEQGIDSHEVDIRADIYSLGATLFRLLTGEAPFPSKKYGTPMKMLMALATESARSIATLRDDLPSGLAEVVDRMLKKKPDERYSTPQEVAAALEPFVAGCDLANLLARARRNSGVEDDGTSLARTNEYLSAPSTETEADAKEPVRAKANQTDRFEITQLAKTLPRPVAWYRRPTAVAAVALGVIGLLLAAVVISIMTDNGELIVKSPDDNVQVTVKRHNGEPVEDIELTQGQGQTTLRSGKYEVVITGDNADQFKITPNIVTLSRNGSEVVTIERKPGGELGRDTTHESADLAANSVLDIKPGSVTASDTPTTKPTEVARAPRASVAMGEPLGPTALVAKPAKIEGVRSWTIETKGHREEVRNVVSFDADSLITSGEDGTVRGWDAKTHKLLRMIFTAPRSVHAVNRIPNGHLLITGGEQSESGHISLWDAETFQLVRKHDAPPFPYMWPQLSPDEKHFVCRSSRGEQILIQNTDNGEITRRVSHQGYAGFGFSPNGEWFASGSSTDVVVKLHSVNNDDTERDIVQTDFTPGIPTDVKWSPDSRLLAVYRTLYYQKPSRIVVWDVITGSVIYRSEDVFESGVIVGWTEDSRDLFAVGKNSIQLIEIDTGMSKWKTETGSNSANWIATSPDGKQFTVHGNLFETFTGKLLKSFDGISPSAWPMVWSPDGRTLAGPSKGGTVAFWSPSASGHLFQIQGSASLIPMNWSFSGSQPAGTGYWIDISGYITRKFTWPSMSGRLFVTDGRALCHYNDDNERFDIAEGIWQGVAPSSDGDRVVAADRAGGIKVWDVATKQIIHVLREQGTGVFQSMWSDDGQKIVVKDGTGITAWSADSGKQIFTTPVVDSGGFAINRTSDKFANVESKSIAIRSMHDGAVLARIDLSPPATTQRSIVWLDDNRTIVVACQDGILRFVDTDSMSTVRVIEDVPPDGGFNDEGSNYTWGLTPHSVRVLETATGRTETITWLRDDNWLIVTDDGHFRASPGAERMLIYAVETEDGNQQIMNPAEFAEKYRWKNDPNQVRLISSD